MKRHSGPLRATIAATACAALLVVSAAGQAPSDSTTLIRHALVIDGSGGSGRRVDVRIRGDRIVDVGALAPASGDRVVEAQGLALSPGFIDTHSHHDRGLDAAPDALAMVSQGVTTIVVGQDGGGLDLAQMFNRLDHQPVSVNVASYVGHGAIRSRVMGQDFKRWATADEVERMKVFVEAEMAAGALGLSTGLEYDPGIYSAPEEVLALAKIAGGAGGRYISHMRSEDRDFWQALDELITIGRVNEMPVQVSHIKLGMHDLWGQTERLIGVLDRARASGVRLTADIYPYTYWSSNLGVLFPKRNFADAAEAEFVLGHVSLAGDIIFNRVPGHADYTGKTLAQVATQRGTSSVKTLLDLLAEPGGAGAGIVAKGMADADVERLIQWPFANVCSDGQSTGLHPRGFGSFSKVLGPYVRDRKLFSLEEAVRKMSSLAAANVGLTRRGLLAPGYFADLVLFDPAVVTDRADFGAAQAQAVGIHTVWVNGSIVFQEGRTTGARAGRALRRETASPGDSPAAQDATRAGKTKTGIAYDVQGKGPVVVLITGSNLDRRMWAREAAWLAKDHTVVRYDLRAHGQSDGATASFSHLGDLQAVLDDLQVAKATLIGLSAGSTIALDAALETPDRVERIVLSGPSISGFRPTVRLPFVGDLMAALQARDYTTAGEVLLTTPVFAAPEEAKSLVRRMVTENDRLWTVPRELMQAPRPAVDRLDQVKVPTLVLIGEQDAFQREQADALAARVPGARLVVIPGGGHLLNLTSPAAFESAVREFIK